MASTRFPGKPLVDLEGKPMIQWVWEAAKAAGLPGDVVIATPDREIAESAAAFGAEVEMTRFEHPSGTDRIAEVAERRPAEIYVNVQGDEPLIEPDTIRACATPLLQDANAEMATLWVPLNVELASEPSSVKVVGTGDAMPYEEALYFSRSLVPHPRDAAHASYRKHLGLYAYRRELLARFATWKPTPLEMAEGLEQLRFLEHGVRIRLARGAESGLAVDLPAHADAVRALLKRRAANSRS